MKATFIAIYFLFLGSSPVFSISPKISRESKLTSSHVSLNDTKYNNFIEEERKFIFNSFLTDRFQWSHNYGYCGEVSMIIACLKYGQYFSQYDIRDIAVIDPINKQSGGHWYNIGLNDQYATERLSLTGIEYTDERADKTQSDTRDYIAWAKQMLRKGYAVTICVYMNHYLFYLNSDPTAGYKEYDHIVTLIRVDSNYDDDLYHPDDIFTIGDHGLWSPRITGPPYYFSYMAESFIGDRETANDPNGPLYTLPKRSIENHIRNYGIAQTGILDELNECLPVSIQTDLNNEDPQIGIQSEVRPEPMAITLTITVSKMEVGKRYMLYKYNDEKKVPTKNFNLNSANSIQATEITSDNGTFVIKESIMTNEKVIYRAVAAP